MTYHAAKLKDQWGRVYDCLVGWSGTERRYHVRCVRDQWSTYIEPERVTGPTTVLSSVSAKPHPIAVAFAALVERGIDHGVQRPEGVHDAAL